MTTLALTADELAQVREILDAHLAREISASVFGSRAAGNAKPWSDLDIVLEGPAALSLSVLSVLSALAEAFDESALPWKVDLVDRRSVNEAFGRIIDAAPKAALR